MRFQSWFRHGKWERRMDAEFRFHLEAQIEDYISRGLTREEATRRARKEFGAVELAKDECRDQRPLEWIAQFFRDARYAGRSLRKNPAFALAAILTIGLGIGATTAIFSALYAVLLKPLPYAEPDQIYSVDLIIPQRTAQFPRLPAPVQIFLEWRKSQTVFSAIAALRPWECNLSGDAEPERLGGARVSTNFFSLLGVRLAHGRDLSSEEAQPGRENVVVISDALWRRRYGADPTVVGRRIDINGDSHQIVGIAPSSLLVPTGTLMNPVLNFAARIDLWKPIAPTARELQGESWDHGVLVRLKPGQDSERGRQQLQAIVNRFFREKGLKTEVGAHLAPIRDIYAQRVRFRLLLVFAASVLLLMIVCTNIANLLLARAASRAAEFATRLALGAGKARIVSQSLAETMLLAVLGGAFGLLLAAYGSRLLALYGPEDARLLASAGLNIPVFLFALAVSAFTGILCGVLPARQAYRREISAGLQEIGRTASASGHAASLRQILVGAEMALGTALLASAGLLLHSFLNVMRADRGYEVERVLAVDLSLYGPRYNRGEDRVSFYRDLAMNVRALPGVLAAGAISDLPDAGSAGASRTIFHPSDSDFQTLVLQRPVAMLRSVTSGYFSASGTSLRAGRYFTDQEPALVALVSESLARSLWPGEGPSQILGRSLRQGNVTGPLITVVGVVQDVRSGAVDRDPAAIIYRPHGQWATGPATLIVRTAQEPSAFVPAVRAAIRKLDSSLPIPGIRTMREIVSDAVSQRRFQMTLIGLFAMVALLLGIVGVYGVVMYSVASRTRDIGLRIALGATGRDVMRWVFSYGMTPVVIGLLLGLGGALLIARLLQSQLFGITSTDPASLGAVTALLLLASAAACYLPARRAARLDPVIALRHE